MILLSSAILAFTFCLRHLLLSDYPFDITRCTTFDFWLYYPVPLKASSQIPQLYLFHWVLLVLWPLMVEWCCLPLASCPTRRFAIVAWAGWNGLQRVVVISQSPASYSLLSLLLVRPHMFCIILCVAWLVSPVLSGSLKTTFSFQVEEGWRNTFIIVVFLISICRLHMGKGRLVYHSQVVYHLWCVYGDHKRLSVYHWNLVVTWASYFSTGPQEAGRLIHGSLNSDVAGEEAAP